MNKKEKLMADLRVINRQDVENRRLWERGNLDLTTVPTAALIHDDLDQIRRLVCPGYEWDYVAEGSSDPYRLYFGTSPGFADRALSYQNNGIRILVGEATWSLWIGFSDSGPWLDINDYLLDGQAYHIYDAEDCLPLPVEIIDAMTLIMLHQAHSIRALFGVPV